MDSRRSIQPVSSVSVGKLFRFSVGVLCTIIFCLHSLNQQEYDAQQEVIAMYEKHMEDNKRRRLVLGGKQVEDGGDGWAVWSLGDTNTACSGTLISNELILTSAHCSKAYEKYTSYVVGGLAGKSNVAKDILQGRVRGYQVRQVQELVIHSEYIDCDHNQASDGSGACKSGRFVHDIALIRVSAFDCSVKGVKAAQLPKEDTPLKAKVTIAGLGFQTAEQAKRKDTPEYMHDMEATREEVIKGVNFTGDKTVCNAGWAIAGSVRKDIEDKVPEKIHCYHGGESSTCQGDSGTGFVRLDGDKAYVVGVDSFSQNSRRRRLSEGDQVCTKGDMWVVNAFAYRDWIIGAAKQMNLEDTNWEDSTIACPTTRPEGYESPEDRWRSRMTLIYGFLAGLCFLTCAASLFSCYQKYRALVRDALKGGHGRRGEQRQYTRI